MTPNDRRFTAVDDDSLAGMIRSAAHRVVLVAPALGKATAQALLDVVDPEGQCPAVDIVLDADEDTCRLGYGDPDGIEILQKGLDRLRTPVRRQEGLRIGVLIVDDRLVIWSPTPRSVEADREPEQPNGLVLNGSVVEDIKGAVAPASDGRVPELGQRELRSDDLEETAKRLAENPPVPYDLARRTRVFSSRFQFVETTVRGAELTERSTKLSSLLLNADLPESLQQVLETQVRPFQSKADAAFEVGAVLRGVRAFTENGERIKAPHTHAQIMKVWEEIRSRYLWHVKGFGWLIRRDRLRNFQSEVDAFQEMLGEWVRAFREQATADEDRLVDDIMTAIKGRLQRSSRKQLEESELRGKVVEGLQRMRVIEPAVKVVIKNVSWESSRDAEFEEALREAVPAEELEGWFEEFTAAPEANRGA